MIVTDIRGESKVSQTSCILDSTCNKKNWWRIWRTL